eukprot:scaffold1602_cov249-Chaetoceros_neogracile.AAC.12
MMNRSFTVLRLEKGQKRKALLLSTNWKEVPRRFSFTSAFCNDIPPPPCSVLKRGIKVKFVNNNFKNWSRDVYYYCMLI